MKIYFATDHAGFELKEILKHFVESELDYEVEDCGAHKLDPTDDYTDFVHKAAKAVARSCGESVGIILGGSGQGEAIVANRYSGVRATVYYGGNEQIVRLSREHNNANILSLGARFLSDEDAKSAVKLWLSTKFSAEERHKRRINNIEIC
jgi:ribose 5-phosphate isomerase B